MALTRKQQKKLGAIIKGKFTEIPKNRFRGELLAENLRLTEIIRDKSVKPRFKKMVRAEIKINKRELAKVGK